MAWRARLAPLVDALLSRRLVGTDSAANRYYVSPPAPPPPPASQKRFVLSPDPLSPHMPVQWSAWLRYARPHPPTAEELAAAADAAAALRARVAALEVRDEKERLRWIAAVSGDGGGGGAAADAPADKAADQARHIQQMLALTIGSRNSPADGGLHAQSAPLVAGGAGGVGGGNAAAAGAPAATVGGGAGGLGGLDDATAAARVAALGGAGAVPPLSSSSTPPPPPPPAPSHHDEVRRPLLVICGKCGQGVALLAVGLEGAGGWGGS